MLDREVVKQVLSGDKEMYRVLVDKYQTGLINYLYGMVGDPATAEDIAQESFIKAYQKLKKYNPDYAFSTWLYKIGINLAYSHLRKKPTVQLPENLTGRNNPAGRYAKKERAQIVRAAVSGLEPQYRSVLSLYYWQDKSYQQIAETVGAPLNTVRTWIKRAKQQLKEELDGKIG